MRIVSYNSELVQSLFQQTLETVLFTDTSAENLIIRLPGFKERAGGEDTLRGSRFPENCTTFELNEEISIDAQLEGILAKKSSIRLYIAANTNALTYESDRTLNDRESSIMGVPVSVWGEMLAIPADEVIPHMREQDRRMRAQRVALEGVLDATRRLLPVGSLLAMTLPCDALSFSNPVARDFASKIDSLHYIIHFPLNELSSQKTTTETWMSCLVVWSIGVTMGSPTRFFKPPFPADQAALSEIMSDLRRLSRQGGGETMYGFVRTDGVPPIDQTWEYEVHGPDLKRNLHELGALGEIRSLADLADIFLGDGTPSDRSESLPVDSEAEIPLLDENEFPKLIAFSSSERVYRIRLGSLKNPVFLQTNDLCITLYDDEEFVKITAEMLPMLVDESIIVVRPHSDVDADFLLAYLNSNRAWYFIKTLKAQNTDGLTQLPIPLPDEMLQAAMSSLRSAIDEMDVMKIEAQHALDSLFDAKPLMDQRLYLLSTGRRTRQRLQAARQVDDFDYRVRTTFPHPLAYRWRTIEAAQPDLEGFFQVLNTAEIVTCYLANVALLLARAIDGYEIGYVESLSKKFSQFRHGTSFGDWIAILREVRDAKYLRRTQDYVPFYEVTRFLDDENVDTALQLLKDIRDRQAHGKGVEGPDVASNFSESRQALRIMLQSVEFLSEYSLRYVEDTRRDTIARMTHFSYRALMGDHPVVPLTTGQTREAEIEKGSLYLTDRNGDLHLFRPFLERRRCPTCGRWAIFYLDTYDPKEDLVTLKAMEHGHTIDDPEIASAFRYIGLLPASTPENWSR